MRRLLGSVARLAVARGVPHAVLDEMLRNALVQAADTAHAELPPHRRVSRISTTTGLHRREAARQLQALREGGQQPGTPRRSRAHELLAHWLTSTEFTDRRGKPRVLPRQGPAPSFESLAQSITRDVHPRAMLEELLRLGMVSHDAPTDTVRLAADAAAPRADDRRMLQFLADNAGDHLDAAVDNVLGKDNRHFEQALFADGLSPRSLAEAREQAARHWQALLRAMAPALEAMVARDDGAADATHRLRIGLYTYDDGAGAPAPSDSKATPPIESDPRP